MLPRTLHHVKQFVRSFHGRRPSPVKASVVMSKRAKLLVKLLENTDQRKNWPLQVGSCGAPDGNIFDKVSRPHRRASVLNLLFMRNITDVLSTGDVCPEILGYGVEITGVRVTSDYGIVNVYWQIPNTEDTPNTDVAMILAKSAPQIRSELISRNVLGKVPRIYFIRDPSNQNAAEFQKCLEASGVDKIKDPPSLPADELMKNLYKFSESQGTKPRKTAVKESEKSTTTTSVKSTHLPETPPDMKCDVMGLDHEKILSQVLTAKRKSPQAPSLETRAAVDGGQRNHNTVSAIPATPLLDAVERQKQMKKFCIDRKAHWAKMKQCRTEELSSFSELPAHETDVISEENGEEDYFDEDYEYK